MDTNTVIAFLIGSMATGGGAYYAFNARVVAIETTINNAHLSEIPVTLARIEAKLKTEGDK